MPQTQTTINLEKGTIDRNSEEAKDRFVRGYTKGVDLGSRTVEGIASTISLDRDREVILPSAFKGTASKFLSGNAPFLAAHVHRTYSGQPSQIGWVVRMEIAAERVTCAFRFSTTDAAEEWWKLASDANGKGIAFSIGFIPVRWIYGSAVDLAREFPELKPIFQAAGLKDEDRLRVYTEIELLEISAVPVPSNREALQILAAKAALAGKAEGDKALDQFKADLAEAMAAKMAGPLKEAITTQLAVLADQVSQLAETIELSSDMVNVEPPDLDAPGPDAKGDDDGDSEDGANTSRAAERLGKAVRS